MLADEAGQVQIGWREFEAGFLTGLAAGAGIGGFAAIHFQFAAAGAPETAVGFLGAFEQQDFVLLAEAVEQGGDFVWERHRRHGFTRFSQH